MDKATALEKVKKCLALAKSANPTEAATAMRQAQKLMATFGLTDADLQLANVRQQTCDVPAGALVAWQANLARVVEEAFGCGHIWSKTRLPSLHGAGRIQRQVIFYGAESAVEVACYTFDVLFRQCAAARAAHVAKQPKSCKPITKTARGDRFANGWVLGVMCLVDRFAGGPEHQQLLEAYASQAWPDCEMVKPLRKDVGRNVRNGDYIDGVAAGRSADLRRGVGCGVGAPLLEGGGS